MGEIIGGLVLTGFLTALLFAQIKRWVSEVPSLLISNVLSLFAATIIGAYGFANGGSPVFETAFSIYFPAQIIILLLSLYGILRSKKGAEVDTNSSLDVAESGNDEPSALDEHLDSELESGLEEAVQSYIRKDKTKKAHFIARHWRGELPLVVSYWVVNFLVTILLVTLNVFLLQIFSVETGYDPMDLFFFHSIYNLIFLVVVVWQVVGVWRSANRYAVSQRTVNQSTFWTYAAQIMVVLGLLQHANQLTESVAPQFRELYRMAFLGDPDIPENEIKLLSGGGELSVYGGIKYGLANDLEAVLDAATGVKVIHLTSGGGRIGEAEKLFAMIKSRGLITYVSNECSSACTVVFAAGKERWLREGAKLGFHGSSFPGMTSEERSQSNRDFANTYEAAGIEQNFIRKALEVAPDDMWYPKTDELLRSNAVTNVAIGGEFALSGHEIGPTLASIRSEFRAANSVIDALDGVAPGEAQALYEKIQKIIVTGDDKSRIPLEIDAVITKIVSQRIQYTNDRLAVELVTLIADQYETLGEIDPRSCYQYAAVGGVDMNLLPVELLERAQRINERILRDVGTIRRPIDTTTSEMAWQTVVSLMTESEFEAIFNSKDKQMNFDLYCDGITAMMKAIASLPANEAAMLLRELYSESQ